MCTQPIGKFGPGCTHRRDKLQTVNSETLEILLTVVVDPVICQPECFFLKVSIENEQYVVDVGYGAPSFFMPLRFVNTTPQTQMTGIYRIRKAKNVDCDYYVEKRLQKFYDMDSEYCNSVSLHFMGNCKHVFEQH